MKGKRILFLYMLMVLGAGCSTGLGRLGETSQEIANRYGAPSSSRTVGDFTRSRYQMKSFEITIFYREGKSALEVFAKRGISQDDARQVVVAVAGHPVGCPSPEQEDQLRQAAGITDDDERFWRWVTPALPINAAFNPVDCTIAFFSDAGVYARIEQALGGGSIAGS
jgi:hypothetical protein